MEGEEDEHPSPKNAMLARFSVGPEIRSGKSSMPSGTSFLPFFFFNSGALVSPRPRTHARPSPVWRISSLVDSSFSSTQDRQATEGEVEEELVDEGPLAVWSRREESEE